MVPFTVDETPRCVITMTPEVFQVLDSKGELAKYGVEMEQVEVIVKGEIEPRLAYRCFEQDINAIQVPQQ